MIQSMKGRDREMLIWEDIPKDLLFYLRDAAPFCTLACPKEHSNWYQGYISGYMCRLMTFP